MIYLKTTGEQYQIFIFFKGDAMPISCHSLLYKTGFWQVTVLVKGEKTSLNKERTES